MEGWLCELASSNFLVVRDSEPPTSLTRKLLGFLAPHKWEHNSVAPPGATVNHWRHR
jgi:hypothetical protein